MNSIIAFKSIRSEVSFCSKPNAAKMLRLPTRRNAVLRRSSLGVGYLHFTVIRAARSEGRLPARGVERHDRPKCDLHAMHDECPVTAESYR